jgi:hypothetical protein
MTIPFMVLEYLMHIDLYIYTKHELCLVVLPPCAYLPRHDIHP